MNRTVAYDGEQRQGYSHQFCVSGPDSSASANASSPYVQFQWQPCSRQESNQTANENLSRLEIAMTSNESKNEMLLEVLIDLAGICKKLAGNSAVPEALRVDARKFREEFDSLLPYRGKGTAAQHAQAEELLTKMARFLPRVLEVNARPRSNVA